MNPAAEIGALAAPIGARYFVDACKMLGQRPVDVRTLGCHGLTAGGREGESAIDHEVLVIPAVVSAANTRSHAPA